MYASRVHLQAPRTGKSEPNPYDEGGLAWPSLSHQRRQGPEVQVQQYRYRRSDPELGNTTHALASIILSERKENALHQELTQRQLVRKG